MVGASKITKMLWDIEGYIGNTVNMACYIKEEDSNPRAINRWM